MRSGGPDFWMIAVQPIIARAGSVELHWDICALDAPCAVGVSVLIGGAAPASTDVVERTNITPARENPYRITFSTGWGEGRYSPKLWIDGIIGLARRIRYGGGGGTRPFVACSQAYARGNTFRPLHS